MPRYSVTEERKSEDRGVMFGACCPPSFPKNVPFEYRKESLIKSNRVVIIIEASEADAGKLGGPQA